MRILGIIPARGGSKTVPGKNIKKLNNKPLLQYTFNVANKANGLSDVILSTDDEAIMEVAKQIGLKVPFKRPVDLALDSSPTLPVIQHALKFFMNKGTHYDAVCLLQVTTPFKTSEFIDKAINKFINTRADALISVQKVPHKYNPHWIFKENGEGNLELFTNEKEIVTRRQDLPSDYYFRDGCIYITKTEVLLEQNSLYGSKISYIESPEEAAINIDTMSDWKMAEDYLKSQGN